MERLSRATLDKIRQTLGEICRDYPWHDVFMHIMADFDQAMDYFNERYAGMPCLSFDEYVLAASRTARENPQLRLGQTYFNVLSDNRPDIAEKIRGGSYDPFYSDYRLPEFLLFAHSHWYDDDED